MLYSYYISLISPTTMTQVKLTKSTFNTLKNFATINKSIVINPGSKIRTISVNKNIFASAEVEEVFPTQVPIYDLGVFLSGLSMFENPIFDFSSDSKVIIKDESGAESNFFYSDPELVVQPPKDGVKLPDTKTVKFTLKPNVLDNLLRAASVYAVQDLCLYSKNGSLVLTVCDKKNETSNSYEVPVGTTDEEDLCYCFKVENLRLQPEEYNVTIYDNRCALFDAVNRDLQYFIALEPQ